MDAGETIGGDARDLIERRRLRRRLGFWRVAAILAVAAAAGAWAWRAAPAGDHVARFAVTGMILDDFDRDATLRALAKDKAVKAVIVRIDSPGGTVAGSEALYEALRDVAEAKPLVAVLGEAAASGGYIAALAADRIVARGATLTGSIGVIAEYPNVEKLLETVGVAFNRVASSELKAEPSPFRAPNAQALAVQAELVDDAYQWFVGVVAARRGLSDARARELGDGRVYSGRQAQAAGLLDDIGGEEAARDWLAGARGVARDLSVRDAEVERPGEGLFGLTGGGARALALIDAWANRPHLMAILR